MDQKDKKIIKELIGNGRIKLKALSKRMNLPITTVYNRMRKMEADGVYTPTIKVNRKKLGYGLEAFILAKVDTSSKNVNQGEIAKKLSKIPQVLDAAVTTGSIDMIIKVTAKDIDELSSVVLEKIRGVGGVASTETLVVLRESESDERALL